MSNLKTQLIKLGSTHPELRGSIRPILDKISSMQVAPTASLRGEACVNPEGKTSSQKTAAKALSHIIDDAEFFNFYRKVKESDTESADLLYRVKKSLDQRLQISAEDDMALNILKNLLHSSRSGNPDASRNAIFKLADLLGIKLPSSSF